MKINDTYTACGIIEGFVESDGSSATDLRAWSYLIRTGAAWHLQGFYGRNAAQLIEMGWITKTGRVQWKKINWNIDEARKAVIG